jgi:hypothetical protein
VEHSALALPIPVPRPRPPSHSTRLDPPAANQSTSSCPKTKQAPCRRLQPAPASNFSWARHRVDRTRSVFTSPTLRFSFGLKAWRFGGGVATSFPRGILSIPC